VTSLSGGEVLGGEGIDPLCRLLGEALNWHPPEDFDASPKGRQEGVDALASGNLPFPPGPG